MITLDTARKLKEAGVKWVPKEGDWFYNTKFGPTVMSLTKLSAWQKKYKDHKKPVWQRLVWLPRLDQILAEIRKRHWWYYMSFVGGEHHMRVFPHDTSKPQCFNDSIPEEAAGLALLHILGGERDE